MAKKAGRSALILLCALALSFVTMVLLFGLKSLIHYDVYSYVLRWIIPFGAIGGGVVAGLGLMVAISLMGYRPPRGVLYFLPLIAIGSHLFYVFLNYWTENFDGIPLRQFLSFPDFLRLYTQSWQMEHGTRHSTVIEGTLLQCLQVAGFGGVQMLFYAASDAMEFCKRCEGLLSTKFQRTLFAPAAERTQEIADEITHDIEEGRMQHAINRFADFGSAGDSPEMGLQAVLTVNVCPKCQQYSVAFRLSERDGEAWRSLDDYTVENTTQEPLEIR